MKKLSMILHFLSSAWNNGFLTCLKKYAVFKGRATRFEYWSFSIIYTLIYITLLTIITIISTEENISGMDYVFMSLLEFIDVNIGGINELETIFHFDVKSFAEVSMSLDATIRFVIINIIFFIVTLLPCTAVYIRRLHDIGRSGWWYIPLLIPSLLCLITDTTPLALAICCVIADISIFILSILPSKEMETLEFEQKLPKKAIIILITMAIIPNVLYLYQTLPVIYFSRGFAYYNNGDYDRAIENYNIAVKIKPKSYVLCARGDAYKDKGDYDKAIEDFNQAIRLDSNYAKAYNDRGLAYYAKGDYDKAITNYNQVIKLNPNDTSVYYQVNLVFIASISQAIKLNPNDTSAYYLRGEAYYDIGDYDNAIADYSQAIKLKPNYANTYYNRGSAYYDKGDYDKAIADFSQVIKLNPNDEEAKQNLEKAKQAKMAK